MNTMHIVHLWKNNVPVSSQKGKNWSSNRQLTMENNHSLSATYDQHHVSHKNVNLRNQLEESRHFRITWLFIHRSDSNQDFSYILSALCWFQVFCYTNSKSKSQNQQRHQSCIILTQLLLILILWHCSKFIKDFGNTGLDTCFISSESFLWYEFYIQDNVSIIIIISSSMI